MITAIEFILKYWKYVAAGVGVIAIGGVIYWYGFHIPAQLEQKTQENKQLAEKLEQAIEAQNKLAEIQHAKDAIDRQTFKQISTLHSKPIKPHSTLIPTGRLR